MRHGGGACISYKAGGGRRVFSSLVREYTTTPTVSRSGSRGAGGAAFTEYKVPSGSRYPRLLAIVVYLRLLVQSTRVSRNKGGSAHVCLLQQAPLCSVFRLDSADSCTLLDVHYYLSRLELKLRQSQ